MTEKPALPLLAGSIVATWCVLMGLGMWWGMREIKVSSASKATEYRRCYPFVDGEPVKMQAAACLGNEPKVIIWGDSFAHSWTPMAQALAAKLKVPAATLARDGCPPLPGASLALRSESEAESCASWNRNAVVYLKTHGADTLILSARWQNFIGADGGETSETALHMLVATVSPRVRRIMIIGPTPTLPDSTQKCLALSSDCSISRADFEVEVAKARSAIRAISNPKVTVVEPSDWLCDSAVCPGIVDGTTNYSDAAHVSFSAAYRISNEVANSWK